MSHIPSHAMPHAKAHETPDAHEAPAARPVPAGPPSGPSPALPWIAAAVGGALAIGGAAAVLLSRKDDTAKAKVRRKPAARKTVKKTKATDAKE